MKKTYMKPDMRVVKIQHRFSVLVGSEGNDPDAYQRKGREEQQFQNISKGTDSGMIQLGESLLLDKIEKRCKDPCGLCTLFIFVADSYVTHLFFSLPLILIIFLIDKLRPLALISIQPEI